MESEPQRRKIEETVIDILKNADLETITEYNVRTMLAEQLNIDFSDVDRKRVIRRAVESFLLSLPVEEKIKIQEETKQVVQEQPEPSSEPNFSPKEACSRVICKLSHKRSVSIQNFRDKNLVSIRDYYQKDGKQFPSAKGISLTVNQWSAFRNSIPAIEEAIVKMESRKSRSECVGKQIEADLSNSVIAFDPQGEILVERKQTEADVSNSMTALAPEVQNPIERQQTEGDMSNSVTDFAANAQVRHNSVTAFPPQALIPIETSRLNGKNYHCWMHQMGFFLKQLKIAYVLTEPCPGIPLHEEASFEEIVQAKAAARKWVDDDYICRRNIMNSLSDHLFDQYSKKTCSAKELWEELKLVYDEDFGTKRSQVNKYIQFQIVDGISVLDQVEELHSIADSIIASGMWIDENFHVSVIVSKLPPSWKECRVKLMHEEFLPLNKLMYSLRVEEDTRNRYRKLESTNNAHLVDSKLENNSGSKMRETKRLCYICANEGHISKHCPRRKYNREHSNRKDSDVVPIATEVKMVERSVRVVDHSPLHAEER